MVRRGWAIDVTIIKVNELYNQKHTLQSLVYLSQRHASRYFLLRLSSSVEQISDFSMEIHIVPHHECSLSSGAH